MSTTPTPELSRPFESSKPAAEQSFGTRFMRSVRLNPGHGIIVGGSGVGKSKTVASIEEALNVYNDGCALIVQGVESEKVPGFNEAPGLVDFVHVTGKVETLELAHVLSHRPFGVGKLLVPFSAHTPESLSYFSTELTAGSNAPNNGRALRLFLDEATMVLPLATVQALYLKSNPEFQIFSTWHRQVKPLVLPYCKHVCALMAGGAEDPLERLEQPFRQAMGLLMGEAVHYVRNFNGFTRRVRMFL